MLNQINGLDEAKIPNNVFLSLTGDEYLLVMQSLEIYHHVSNNSLETVSEEQSAYVTVTMAYIQALHARLLHIITAEYANETTNSLLKDIENGKFNVIK